MSLFLHGIRRIRHAGLRWSRGVCVVLLGATLAPCLPAAAAGRSATGGETGAAAAATLTVGATVEHYARLEAATVPGALRLRADDVTRGWVEIPAAVTLRVRTNSRSGYQVRFAYAGSFATRVRLTGSDLLYDLTPEHPVLERPSNGPSREDLAFDTRIFLAPDAVPGLYYWPLTPTTVTVTFAFAKSGDASPSPARRDDRQGDDETRGADAEHDARADWRPGSGTRSIDSLGPCKGRS